MITNPVLPGFNPDPCILRDGDDYYIATSTFEWHPGVQIHHSRDLVHWRLLTRPLTRGSQLDLAGVVDSGGVWAPALSRADGLFWLIYTNVRQFSSAFKDTLNYLVTAPAIEGPWSEPVYLNASGFDPSLFHDDDGRKWLLNMRWEFRPGRNRFSGIVLQEYSAAERRMVGPVHTIFTGTRLGITEGPHLFKRDGWYYLVTAEGGTSWTHAVTIARSRQLIGPYDVHPENPLLTSHNEETALAKAGHASFVQAASGEWFMAHLCARPVGPHRRCILGRETAIQAIEWGRDGWPRLAQGGRAPAARVPAPGLPVHPFAPQPARTSFDCARLPIDFQTLRCAADPSWLSFTARPGWLRLVGRESPASRHEQSLVARRIQHFQCAAATRVEFEPRSFQQMAGLLACYDSSLWYYLQVTFDEEAGRVVKLLFFDHGVLHERSPAVPVPSGAIERSFELRHEAVRFLWRPQGDGEWRLVGEPQDATLLSDEYTGPGNYGFNFTGAFAALACHDVSGQRLHADFAWFEYRAVE